MKTSHSVMRGLMILALVVTPNLFAANRGRLHVSSPEDVAGQPLAAGDYIVLWEDRGPGVALRIMHGREVVASATGHAVPLQNPAVNDSVVINMNSGRHSLSLIYFSGKTVALKIDGPSEAMSVNNK
jgi:hypothetical protein